MPQWDKIISEEASHCTFSPNLFHGQITQKSINKMSSPENKKCGP
jgi:hypothetical protein